MLSWIKKFGNNDTNRGKIEIGRSIGYCNCSLGSFDARQKCSGILVCHLAVYKIVYFESQRCFTLHNELPLLTCFKIMINNESNAIPPFKSPKIPATSFVKPNSNFSHLKLPTCVTQETLCWGSLYTDFLNTTLTNRPTILWDYSST